MGRMKELGMAAQRLSEIALDIAQNMADHTLAEHTPEPTWMTDKTILVWRFHEAPTELQRLSPHGGDEDWLAWVPDTTKGYIGWLDYGPFGVCDISRHPYRGGVVYIGAHS